MNDEKINTAINFINGGIAKLTKEFAHSQNDEKELKEKIEVLEKMKEQVYSGNVAFAEKIIEKHQKGEF